MYQHPTEQQLTEYRQRTLAPDAFLAVHGHVSECARCAARCYEPSQSCTDYETLLAALTPAADEPPYHLTHETAAAYIVDKLDEIDREPVVTHLEVCAECAAMVEQLRALPAASPAAQPPASAADRRRLTWMQLWPVGLPQLRPLQLAAAGLLLVALLATALLLLRARDSQPAKLVRQDAPSIDGNLQPTPAPSPQSEPTQAQAAPIVLALNDGGEQITLDAQGNLAGLEQLPEQVRRQIKATLITQQLARPAVLADLNRQPSTLLGAADNNGLPFRLIAPLGAVVESDRPSFRWQSLAGAETYIVTVTDNSLNEVASSGPLSATTWRMPQPLARGVTYSWQVTARRQDGQTVTSPMLPAPQAKFQVLARARLDELQRVRSAYPDSHLSLGVLYAQAGLLDEAMREFQALVRANPQSPVARKLLRSVRAQRSSPIRMKPAQ